MHRHIGQQTLPSISHPHGIYTIDNLRDFQRTSEHSAEQRYTTRSFPLSAIQSCNIYQSLFGLGKRGPQTFAHYMVGFMIEVSPGKIEEVIVSIEARRPAGGVYSLWKGILPRMYGLICVRGTPGDLIGLRKNIWKETLTKYTMTLSHQQSQNLFLSLVHLTNDLIHHPRGYNALVRNCITDLYSRIRRVSHGLPRFTRAVLRPSYYVAVLQKHQIIANQKDTLPL